VTTKTVADRGAREMEIIRSAYRIMARQGSHRITLVDIAAEAGVSKALLLYHFGTKDALLHDAMQWALERTEERIRRRLEQDMSGKAAIRSLVAAVFVDAAANRDFYLFYIDLVEHAARVPKFGGLPAMLTNVINGLYTEVIVTGIHDGSFAISDADLAARHMRALIEGTFLQWLQTPDWSTTHGRWRDDCCDALFQLLGARPDSG